MSNGHETPHDQTEGGDRYGPVRVAVLALSDRTFFQWLMTHPEEAVRGVSERLGLTEEDIEAVVRMVEESREDRDVGALLEIWDENEIDGTSVWVRAIGVWVRLCE